MRYDLLEFLDYKKNVEQNELKKMRETCIVVKLNQSKDTQKKYKKLPDRGKFCIKIIIILTPDFSSTERVFRSHQCILSKFWVKMLLNLDFYTLQWVISMNAG